MDQNIFFRWVWRFNALGLALALIANGFLIATLLLPRSSVAVGSAPEAGPPIPTDAAKTLEMARVIEGTGTVIFSYGTQTDFSGGSLSVPRFRQVANYLFYNSKDGSANWLFAHNDQQIATISYVTDSGKVADYAQPTGRILPNGTFSTETGDVVRALVYDVVAASTDRQAKRVYQVFASRPDGTQLTKLIDSADEITKFTALDATTIMIAYRHDGHMLATTFSLTDFKPILEKDLEALVQK